MTPNPNPATGERRFALRQAGLLALVLALFGIATAVAQWCVRNDWILLPSRMAEWKRTNGNYLNTGFYRYPEERLLNEVLPDADYSQGGVYLLGASGVQTGVALWERPALEQRFIHNYGFRGITLTQEFQFVRYLVEQSGLLRAGGDKTSVIIGAAVLDSTHLPAIDPNPYRMSLQGVVLMDTTYTYDTERGFRPLDISPGMRWFRRNQIRNREFWTWSSRVLLAGGARIKYLDPVNLRPAAEDRKFWLDWMGRDWENGMDAELDQLRQMIDYLQSRKVNVNAVYLPTASWTKGFPPADRFRQKVLGLFSSKSVPVVDLADAADDNDFQDSFHLGYVGVHKIQPAFLGIAQAFLRRTGLLH